MRSAQNPLPLGFKKDAKVSTTSTKMAKGGFGRCSCAATSIVGKASVWDMTRRNVGNAQAHSWMLVGFNSVENRLVGGHTPCVGHGDGPAQWLPD